MSIQKKQSSKGGGAGFRITSSREAPTGPFVRSLGSGLYILCRRIGVGKSGPHH